MSRKSNLKKKLDKQVKRKQEPMLTAVCDSCRVEFLQKNMTFGEDPFASEIYNNKTKVWLCDPCHRESCRDI